MTKKKKKQDIGKTDVCEEVTYQGKNKKSPPIVTNDKNNAHIPITLHLENSPHMVHIDSDTPIVHLFIMYYLLFIYYILFIIYLYYLL